MADDQPPVAKYQPPSENTPQPAAQLPEPQATPAPAQQTPPAPTQTPEPAPNNPPSVPPVQPELSEWQAAQVDDQFAANQPTAPIAFEPFSWTMNGYIEHEKSPIWYGALIGATIGIAVILFLLTHEKIVPAVIITVGGSAAFFAGHTPGSKEYEVTADKIRIGQKSYNIEDFRSFSLVEEGIKNSIWLRPVKRFTPYTIIYYPPEVEEQVFRTFSALLPHEDRKVDNLDKLTQKLKF